MISSSSMVSGSAVRRGSPTPIGSMIDAAIEAQRALHEAGLPVAGAFMADACRSLRLAAKAEEVALARERLPEERPVDGEHKLILVDGRDTGCALRIEGPGSLALRWSPDPHAGRCAPPPPAAIPTPDPCWDLIASPEAAEFAADDLAAALLAAALADHGWISSRHRLRVGATASAAALAVRVLRSGRAAPTLRPIPAGLLDRGVADLLRSLGWRPEYDLDLAEKH